MKNLKMNLYNSRTYDKGKEKDIGRSNLFKGS